MLLFFISKSPGGYAIYCPNERVLEMQNFNPAYMKGWTYVRTYSVYDDFLRTKISWMQNLPNFLTHGAPLRARELRYNMIKIKKCSFFVFVLSAEFGIKEPLPENVFVVKNSSAQISCVAYDDNDAAPVMPEKILFKRKSKFSTYTTLTPTENIYFTNRTEGKTRMLLIIFSYLHHNGEL